MSGNTFFFSVVCLFITSSGSLFFGLHQYSGAPRYWLFAVASGTDLIRCQNLAPGSVGHCFAHHFLARVRSEAVSK